MISQFNFYIVKRVLTETAVHRAEMGYQVDTAYRVEEEKMLVLKMLCVEMTDATVFRKSLFNDAHINVQFILV